MSKVFIKMLLENFVYSIIIAKFAAAL